MPLPKLPTKPASLLSPKDYPKANQLAPKKSALVAPAVNLQNPPAPSSSARGANTAVKSIKNSAQPNNANKSPVANSPITSKTNTKKSSARVVSATKLKNNSAKSPISKAADKKGVTKLFVLDTNVLMHDPTSLFRFEEHDVYLPMITLEELDDHKKGMSEVARNARQISRSLDALVGSIENGDIES